MLKRASRYLYNDEVDIRLRLYVLSAAMTVSMLLVLSIEVLAFSGRWEYFGAIWAVIALLVVIGIANIRERLGYAGANLSIASQPEKGTVATIIVPKTKTEENEHADIRAGR